MTLVQKEPKKIYIWVEATPITTAGIYRNEELGLISLSSDGANRITIADKNLGATTVYNNGDALGETNCGKLYQRGNNYGFIRSGSITTSGTQVNASNYGPNNYYSSSTFITIAGNWDSSDNKNLWGDTTNTLVARKGPCSTGYHVPTQTDRQNVYDAGVSLGAWSSSNGTGMINNLKLPAGGWRDQSATLSTGRGNYWTSSSRGSNDRYHLFLQTNAIYPNYSGYPSYGLSIRPFKNDAVQPLEGSGWTKLNS